MYAVCTEALIKLQNDFRVGLGMELFALGKESVSQFLEVIDFAVECNPVAPISKGHGLMACWTEVEDGKAGMSECGLAICGYINSLIVRATML
jgi:hypothetical protein